MLGVRHLAPAEDAHDLDLVARLQELAALVEAVLEVVGIDGRSHAELLELRAGVLLTAALLLLPLLVLELAEVHDAADRRPGRGRDLDEVEPRVIGALLRIGRRDDAHLLAVLVHQADFTDSDLTVATEFRTLLQVLAGRSSACGHSTPGMESESGARNAGRIRLGVSGSRPSAPRVPSIGRRR